MLKSITGLFLLLTPLLGLAQITINAQLPAGGMVQKEQLWNLVLVNNSNSDFEAKVLLNLQDASTGQSVLSAGTPSFTFGKGLKIINGRDVQPVQYTYGATGAIGNYLPLGSYMACYSVCRVRSDAIEKLAEECIRITISPLSPPMLVAPTDKSTLPNNLPQFSWMAPAPLDLFTDLNYELTIAEVLAGQSSSQALLYNPPVYAKTNSRTTYETYPSSYSKLEAGKSYAWQVTARNGQSYSAPTEIWTFSIAGDTTEAKESSPSYVLLKSNKDEAGVSYVADSLYVKYYSFDKEHDATVRFLSSDGKVMEEKKQRIMYGDNFLKFKIGSRYQKGKLYTLEITDQQKNSYTALFSIKPSN